MAVIELPDEQAAALKAQAHARGLTLGQWIISLAGHPPSAPVVHESCEPAAARPIWEVIADNMKKVPAEDLALLPKDGASQLDHYLYGHPKREQ